VGDAKSDMHWVARGMRGASAMRDRGMNLGALTTRAGSVPAPTRMLRVGTTRRERELIGGRSHES
jgi:hypothetical protein